MTPLKTETLDLTFKNNVAHIAVTGAIAKDTLEAGLEWIDGVVEANDNFSVRVDMAKDDFADLSEISGEFKQVGRMLRHASLEENVGADKCAVLTDSLFLRNSAKVEGAVIPGLEVNTFALEAADVAQTWLQDEPLMEESSSVETAKSDAPKTETIHASVGPAPTSLNLVTPSQMKQGVPDTTPDTTQEASDDSNPWSDFRVL